MSAAQPYLDPSLSISERVEDLLGQMTLPEKVGQMLQLNAQEDLEDIVLNRHAGSILHTPPERLAVAHDLVQQTRLRIPLVVADDCIHGHSFWPGATILPSQLGMACTWNPDLVRAGARMTAVEVAPTGIHWTFSPVLCIGRDLRWGRVDETFGEDPHLLGELGVAMVEGYQGSGLDDPTAILACAKHFAGYSETIGGRDASEADISRRKLRSWFLPPFERVARAGCRSFMLGYESIDGIPITANEWVLSDVLRGEWGFTGTLVTDWNNVGSLVTDQKVAADITEAAAIAITCGNDFVMTTPTFFEGAQDAVAKGLVTEAQVDDQVRRILALKFALGLFENPRHADSERQQAVIGTAEHRELALEQARRSLVLLRNEDALLPLDRSSSLKVAVVGPNADDVQNQLGDWAGGSGQVEWMADYLPRELTETIWTGLQQVAPQGWELTHVRGVGIGQSEQMGVLPDGQPFYPEFQPEPIDQAEFDRAVEAARAADVAVVVVGDNIALTGEGRSTATLELMGGQVALLDAVAATGTPMVVVVVSGKPLVLPESARNSAALVWAFNPGMRGGLAFAELLTGAIEPSGRLPISIPRHVGQQPLFYNQVRGVHGQGYADLTFDPLYGFGQGLGYTRFEYSDLLVTNPEVTEEEMLHATVVVRNTGSRPGRETVQVYVRDVVTSVTWADRELKHFQQVDLEAGESRLLQIDLPVSACTIVDRHERRVVEAGAFELLVGHSSRTQDLLAASFEVVAREQHPSC